jgi:hypothetical protein
VDFLGLDVPILAYYSLSLNIFMYFVTLREITIPKF